MENLIEHEGVKYKAVEGGSCTVCVFMKRIEMCQTVFYGDTKFPDCSENDCHFELVTETDQKE